MRIRTMLTFLAGILSLSLLTALPAAAGSVHQLTKAASGNGVDCGTIAPADLATANCQSLTNNPPDEMNFYTLGEGAGLSFFDIFSIPNIQAGTDVTFVFGNAPGGVVPDGSFGVLACDNTLTSAVGSAFAEPDSSSGGLPVFMSNACTGLAPGTDASSLLNNGTNDPVTSWNFVSNGGATTWFFYAETSAIGTLSPFLPTSATVTNGTAPIPEPGTLGLFALGLLGLAIASRRRAQA
jgi:hypothetical protein